MARKRAWTRPLDERWLGGVSPALARGLNVDVTLIRVAWVLLALLWGVGALAYLALWWWLPLEGHTTPKRRRLRLERFGHEVQGVARRYGSSLRNTGRMDGQRRAAAFVLFVGGAGLLLWSFGALDWLTPTRTLGVACIVVGGAVLLPQLRQQEPS